MDQYEYLLRQYRLATKMELTDENIIIVLEELQLHSHHLIPLKNDSTNNKSLNK